MSMFNSLVLTPIGIYLNICIISDNYCVKMSQLDNNMHENLYGQKKKHKIYLTNNFMYTISAKKVNSKYFLAHKHIVHIQTP